MPFEDNKRVNCEHPKMRHNEMDEWQRTSKLAVVAASLVQYGVVGLLLVAETS